LELKKYSISEASKIIGYQSYVLRYYEKEFDLSIPRNKSNHRYYTINEIEVFQNIKQLQEKGLTNNQIKIILNSPEVIEENIIKDETAITISNGNVNLKNSQELSLLVNDIKENINEGLVSLNNNFKQSFEDVKCEINSLKTELVEKDQDIILCENAKLRMKIKQKSYEIAELKEQLSREKNKKKSIIKRIFS
jgi:DNA-binding transcriptional MerR regulator